MSKLMSEEQYLAQLDAEIAERQKKRKDFAEFIRLSAIFKPVVAAPDPETPQEFQLSAEESDTADRVPIPGYRLPERGQYTYPREALLAIACMNPSAEFTRKRMVRYLRKVGYYADANLTGTARRSVGAMFSILTLNGFMEPVPGKHATYRATAHARAAFEAAEHDVESVFRLQGTFKDARRGPISPIVAERLRHLGLPTKHVPIPRGMGIQPPVDTASSII